MDVRGIEVTNQLRSAIRAKLLELGVRYDEELPDYILVMVVNKKTRQQMHEDLNLFLEDSTTPFVDWLHDQVLKKLQKVTVAKQKKAQREFVPTVVVKQEEEKRKKKIGDDLKVKDEPEDSKSSAVSSSPAARPSLSLSPAPKAGVSSNPAAKSVPSLSPTPKAGVSLSPRSRVSPSLSPGPRSRVTSELELSPEPESRGSGPSPGNSVKSKTTDAVPDKFTEPADKINQVIKDKICESTKRSVEDDFDRPDKRLKTTDTKELESNEADGKKLKSCVNKPRITSVVSVKTRLGCARNKFEVHRNERERIEAGRTDRERSEADRRQTDRLDKRVDRRLYEPRRDSRRTDDKRVKDEKNRPTSAVADAADYRRTADKKPSKDDRRTDRVERNVKDRLGQIKAGGKFKDKVEEVRNVRSRLGPVKSKFIALGRLGVKNRVPDTFGEGKIDGEEEEEEDEEEEQVVGPVKSRIIAVNNSDKAERKTDQLEGIPRKLAKETVEEEDEEEEGARDKDKAIASKVIVTPRPLKPLQPAQKRATQSLLLRAVAEANQSVVKQKNPEPALLDKKPVLKRLQPMNMRASGKNFSVHLNATKRLVMEKIQVELTTSDTNQIEPEPYVPRAVTDEQMGVVMSLFKRGNDNQKFLVTLNGYNNNINKEQNYSDDDGLEMEVNEDDQLVLSTSQSESFINSEMSFEQDETDDNIDNIDSNLDSLELENFNSTEVTEDLEDVENEDQEKSETGENNENQCTDNINNLVTDQVTPRKRRKLSPIVYTRSPSPSPEKTKSVMSTVICVGKKSPIGSSAVLVEKSRDKCRYWPNCTLGNKCAFTHPPVPCSAFPACKFGDKCAYKHPKCKFGLSCTKLGCVFSHPSQQCKYHPFCTKPGCMYLHPQAVPSPVVAAAATAAVAPLESVRAKFTWRRRD
ncbi:zinc finger CCCH domain-containing protein 14 [Microplitis mediator]|uniref:zinc finger CCCH domain-containing protein 14 n=1 Tax=Microplitis mediator TaxID=375433 RepID=UPI002552844C|nr:zinc finger CCCH domain-containing protein 14 [Microplitis mediator]